MNQTSLSGDPVLPTNEDQPANNSSNFVDIPEESLKKMKVSELKSELSKHGQPVFGLKAVLLERLRSALQQLTEIHPSQRGEHFKAPC